MSNENLPVGSTANPNSKDAPYSPFPSDFLDPSLKKKPKYNLDYARAAYYEYIKNIQLLTVTRRADFIDNRLYADGNQNNQKYKKGFTYKDPVSQKEVSFVDLDYTPVSIIPGYRDIVISYLEKMEYDIDFVSVDPVSDNLRNQQVYGLWAEKKLDTILQQQGIKDELAGGQSEKVFPETMEELEILKSVGFKLKWEMAMKGIIDLDFYENNWKEIRRKIYEDLFDNGIAGCREFTTKEGRHIIRWCDMVNMYIRQTHDKECKDSTAIGEMTEMSLADFVAQAGEQFTQAEYMEIAKRCTNPQNNAAFYDYMDTDSIQSGGWISWYMGKFSNLRVRIFDIAWLSFDKFYYEEKLSPNGEKMTFEKPFGFKIPNYEYTSEESIGGMKYYRQDKESGKKTEMDKNAWENEVKQPKQSNRKVVTENRKMVYGAKWVVGTDFVYDYGLQYDIPRDPMPNGRETNLPFHIYRLTNKSIIERIKPFVDAFMLSWLKIQNAKAKARPKGIKIELDSLENMTIGGKEFTPLQALSVYDQTGNIIYKGTGQFGEASRHSPVEEMQGGMGAEYAELIGDLNFNIRMCQEITGFNSIMLGQSPDPNQPVKTAQLAMNASSNAIYPLQEAMKNIHIRAVKSTACRFQIMSRNGQLKGYDAAISEPMRKVIEYDGDLLLHGDGSPINLGIKIVARPTMEQRAKIEDAALKAMQPDASGFSQITYSDYLFIMRILEGGNLRYSEQVLAHRIQKRIEEKQQKALEMQKQNGIVQMQSAQAAEEQKRLTLKMATDEAIRLEIAKGRIQMSVDSNKMDIQMQIEGVKTKGKIIQSETTSNAKVLSSIINNEHESKLEAVLHENEKEIVKLTPKPKKVKA